MLFNTYAAGGLFGRYKMMQKTYKNWILAHGYSYMRVLNESFPINTNMTGCLLVLWTKEASALEGLWSVHGSNNASNALLKLEEIP